MHFELARLQTLFDSKPEIRNRILKRYKEVKSEYEGRKLRVTWGEHELDKLLKNEVRENFDKNIGNIKHVLKIVKVQEAKHEVGPLKGEGIIGVYSYAVVDGKGSMEVAKNTILKFEEKDYVEAYRDLDGKIKLLGKVDYGVENGEWINKDGKFIFEVKKESGEEIKDKKVEKTIMKEEKLREEEVVASKEERVKKMNGKDKIVPEVTISTKKLNEKEKLDFIVKKEEQEYLAKKEELELKLIKEKLELVRKKKEVCDKILEVNKDEDVPR